MRGDRSNPRGILQPGKRAILKERRTAEPSSAWARRKEVMLIATVELGLMSYERAARMYSRIFMQFVARRLSEGASAGAILNEANPLLASIAECFAMIS